MPSVFAIHGYVNGRNINHGNGGVRDHEREWDVPEEVKTGVSRDRDVHHNDYETSILHDGHL